MEEKQAITVRLSEEAYGKVKKYADEVGESLGGAMCRIVEEFFKGEPHPSPGQPPAPAPGAPPENPADLQGLSARVRKLEEGAASTQGYLKGITGRMDTFSDRLSYVLAKLGEPPIIDMPESPWKGLGSEESRKKAERLRVLVQEVGTHPAVLLGGLEGLEDRLKKFTEVQMTVAERNALREKVAELKSLSAEVGKIPEVQKAAWEELERRSASSEVKKRRKS
ncbi:MAG: hypothetical protein PHN75_15875 [Syntrophales bacterium]|nr:hypothetical protein [Syntrophales bacterium]